LGFGFMNLNYNWFVKVPIIKNKNIRKNAIIFY
jgi:hypothetical protein